MGDVEKWNQRYLRGDPREPAAARVLTENQHLLPEHGLALELACGRAGNAILMAQHGLEVHAWDLSAVAIRQLKERQAELGIRIHPLQRDIVRSPPAPESFDVIVISRFLDRKIIPAIITALRPGGLIFYQTFIKDKVTAAGPKNPDYLLETNELLRLFRPLQIIVYREEGSVGNIRKGLRNEALLVAKKNA